MADEGFAMLCADFLGRDEVGEVGFQAVEVVAAPGDDGAAGAVELGEVQAEPFLVDFGSEAALDEVGDRGVDAEEAVLALAVQNLSDPI